MFPYMRVSHEAVTHLRERSGLSLTALAAHASISKHTLWKLEQGVTVNPHPATVKAIAEALRVPIAAIAAVPEEAA